MDPVFAAQSPDGRWRITMKLLPTETTGREWYLCEVILDGKQITDRLITRDQAALFRWMKKQMIEIMRHNQETP